MKKEGDNSITVQDNAIKVTKEKQVTFISWAQFNRIVEGIWDAGNKVEYAGEDISDTEYKTIYCVFQELIRQKNGSYKPGKFYCIDNDIVIRKQTPS